MRFSYKLGRNGINWDLKVKTKLPRLKFDVNMGYYSWHRGQLFWFDYVLDHIDFDHV